MRLLVEVKCCCGGYFGHDLVGKGAGRRWIEWMNGEVVRRALEAINERRARPTYLRGVAPSGQENEHQQLVPADSNLL